MLFVFSNELLGLFRDFYTMTDGIKISIFEYPTRVSQYDMTLNFHNCVVYPSIDMGDVFCKAIRCSRAVDERCLQCDQHNASLCHQSEKTNVYRCHLGFLEAQIPVAVEGKHAAILFLGQISDTEASEEHFNRLWFDLRRIDGEFFTDDKRELFWKHYTKISRMSEQRFRSLCSFLHTVSRDWVRSGFVSKCVEAPMESIHTYIQLHIGTAINTDALCSALHLSRATLYRILKKETGLGLNNYVNRCKMEHARLLLCDNYSVGESAAMLGYDNVNYFSRLFREQYGSSPSEYRRSHEKKDADTPKIPTANRGED
ncbi:MAG: helix-turn-helix domain-containing protein [Clostridia bacterium]|nr:helix-turn-helix domain-containing protein [Clostridia bacterium]